MEVVSESNTHILLRFDRGEDLLSALKGFCATQGITGAAFTGIGASSELTLAFYDLAAKVYHDRTLNEPLEIASLNGNVATFEGDVVIHAHGVFGDREHRAFGGHVKHLVVSATAEVVFTRLPGDALRMPDEATGLNLLRRRRT